MNSNSLTPSMYCFDNLIQELELYNPPLLNAKFTWSNFRTNPICCRLDRFFVTGGWMDIFPSVRHTVLRRITSDHNTILLDTARLRWGPTPFRFENAWLLHHKLKEEVKAWWNTGTIQGWEGFKFMSKLKEIKSKVKKWNFEVFGDVNVRISELQNKISQLDAREEGGNSYPNLQEHRREAKCDLETLNIRKFQMESQKAKVKWLQEGDQNTKFFHTLLIGRRNRAIIEKIELEDGSVVSEEKAIENTIVGFYKHLYRASEGDGTGIEGLEWSPLDSVDAEHLEVNFSEDKSKKQFLNAMETKHRARMVSRWPSIRKIGIQLNRIFSKYSLNFLREELSMHLRMKYISALFQSYKRQ
ncbi:uncharacterized protein [Primulina eburnea]|uniref:uncharacterized protein n=1 Tax=Primulina eburnea TaxID=1245227 RepID=UPI003C6CA7F4